MARLLPVLLAVAIVLSACGSDGGDAGTAAAPPEPTASAKPADFPAAKGKTAQQLTEGLREGAILTVASFFSQRKQHNRLGFAIVDRANKQIDVAAVAVYTDERYGSGLRGPFVARKESLAVKPEYSSAQTASDLASGDTFYVADPSYSSNGKHNVFGLVRLDGRLVIAAALMPLTVGAKKPPPLVGEPAIRTHTETAADVGGDLSKLSTRVPPPEDMLKDDFADVVGRKPVVLLFATPALCQTRTCGPVVDIAEQVRHARPKDDVAWIHMEIYNNNQVNDGYRPQFLRYHLPSEPYLFTIDRKGRIAAQIEGAYSADELTKAVEAAVKP